MHKKLLIASTSTIYNGKYLEYLEDELVDFFKAIQTIVFVPYARPSGITHDEYTAIAQKGFEKANKKIVGLHTFDNPALAIEQAEAIFTGGGNTFLLVKQLYDLDLITPLRYAINNGTPYMGTSAGSNITGLTMKTTNDMPIVYPPSFDTLGVVPFNINPHYLDPIPNLKHMGETRETRIQEFLMQNDTPVVGIREGGWLRVEGDKITLKGEHTARIFRKGLPPFEHQPGNFSIDT